MENEQSQKTNPSKSVPEQIENLGGRWLVPVIGFIYACGFLIAFIFFKGYGITDLNFIEAKYIHVGSFFVIACVAVILPLTWFKYLLPSKSKYPHVTIQTILAATLMLYVIFGALLFAPRGFYHDHLLLLTLNFLLPCGMLLTGIFVDFRENSITNSDAHWNGKILEKKVLIFQWVLLFFQLISVVLTFIKLDNFWEMWREEPVCIAFIGLMLLILLYGSRLLKRLSRVQNERQKLDLILSNGCIIGLLVYLAIWSFARSVYPFIPASKGGGDFASEKPVHIIFKADSGTLIPEQVKTADITNHLIILEENNGFFYVADNSALKGSKYWQGKMKPPVYEIAQDSVVTIIHNNAD